MTMYTPTYLTASLSDLYLSIGQAAYALQVNRATIRRWLKQGKLKGEKIGLTTLIPKNDIIMLAQERQIKLVNF